MCKKTKLKYGCGDTYADWRFCSRVSGLESEKRVTRNRQGRWVPNCDHLVKVPDEEEREYCCTLQCCSNGMIPYMQAVRNFEAKCRVSPGSREGLGDEKEKFAAAKPADADNLEKAQNWSLQEAVFHLNVCGRHIYSDHGEPGGIVHDARNELGLGCPPEVNNVEDRYKMMWTHFKFEIARSSLRHPHLEDPTCNDFMEGAYRTAETMKSFGAIKRGELLLLVVLSSDSKEIGRAMASKHHGKARGKANVKVLSKEDNDFRIASLELHGSITSDLTKEFKSDSLLKFYNLFLDKEWPSATSTE